MFFGPCSGPRILPMAAFASEGQLSVVLMWIVSSWAFAARRMMGCVVLHSITPETRAKRQRPCRTPARTTLSTRAAGTWSIGPREMRPDPGS